MEIVNSNFQLNTVTTELLNLSQKRRKFSERMIQIIVGFMLKEN